MIIVSLILLQVFIFGGLAFFLSRFLTRNVTSATTHLQGMIHDNEEKQEEIKKKLELSQKESEQMLKKAEEDVGDIKEEAQKKIEAERDAIITAANNQSETIISNAKKTSDAMIAELEKNINNRAIHRAGELICKVIPQETCLAMHGQWVDSLIFEGLSGLGHLRVPDDVENVVVITAFALTGDQQQRLRKKLKEILNRDFSIEEKVNPKLVAGFVIGMGNLFFDGSFDNKVKEIVRLTIENDHE